MTPLVFKSEEKTNYGPTIENGFVRRTSVSALTSFDPTQYAGCPRRWWWKYVANKKEPETGAQKLGKEVHKQIEEYLKTGVDTLGPVARAGKHLLPKPGSDLIIEAQFGDFEKAIKLRDLMKNINPRDEEQLLDEMHEAAGLVAGHIPLDGYIDLRYARGEWIDNDGNIHREDSKLGKVVCVSDHKTTSSIENYAKSPGELVETVQMPGYAQYVVNVVPDVDHVRVEHNNFQTRYSKMAKKATAILSRRVIEDKWRRINQLAIYMEEVARCARPEDVESQPKSCNSYREGCPHRGYCPEKPTFKITHTKQNTNGGEKMSLFASTKPSTNGTTNGTTSSPPVSGSLFGAAKPASPPADRSAIDAAKQRLAEEDGIATKPTPAPNLGFCSGCGTKMTLENTSKSARTGEYRHVQCPAQTTVNPESIIPPDAARPTATNSAVPLPATAREEVTDAEIIARDNALREAKAQEEAAKKNMTTSPASPAATKVSGGGRCSSGGQNYILNQKEIATRKTKCPGCTKDIAIKDDYFTSDFTAITIPNHNQPKVETPPATRAPETQQNQPVATQNTSAAAQGQESTKITNAISSQPATGLQILVDAVKVNGPRAVPIEEYWSPMVAELEKQGGGGDLRCAPKDSPMAYGAWKGFLTSWVKEKPPAPGIYFARGSNEFDMVVVDALGKSADVTRGVR